MEDAANTFFGILADGRTSEGEPTLLAKMAPALKKMFRARGKRAIIERMGEGGGGESAYLGR